MQGTTIGLDIVAIGGITMAAKPWMTRMIPSIRKSYPMRVQRCPLRANLLDFGSFIDIADVHFRFASRAQRGGADAR
jgi:hypothetical protein